ncbi:uncharacterized protein DSM5745_07241 [Aspergillus mulundensis]|uniref:Uncharacterized protein n=1 Tax=Aspergillus mulundensis TaxID=1810919 RepID=A0A3D8RKK2_9EURO|nr:hypothetical protein DSM5745_07241 [Aspergillus mulundensis]RDW74579.1 hypothetical protein DSM5745_07241 [Aspergillus mulundensis]
MMPHVQNHSVQAQAQAAPGPMDISYDLYPEPQPNSQPQSQDRPHLKRPFTSVSSPSPTPSLPVLSSVHSYGYGLGYGYGYGYGHNYGRDEPYAKRNTTPAFEHGFHDKTYAQRFQERLDSYNACKEKELAAPFSPDRGSSYDSDLTRSPSSSPNGTMSEGEEDAEDDASLVTCFKGCGCEDDGVDVKEDDGNDDVERESESVDGDIQSEPYPQPQVHIPRHQTENYAPLSNAAISDILLRCAPHSLSAQAWIRAHRPTNIDHERKIALLKQQDDLRRRVLQLRPKTEWTMNRLKRGEGVKRSKFAEDSVDLSKSNPMFMRKEVPRSEKKLDYSGFSHHGRTYIFDEEDKQWLKVFMSTGRLQEVAGNEEASIIPAQEFRRYFDISDE